MKILIGFHRLHNQWPALTFRDKISLFASTRSFILHRNEPIRRRKNCQSILTNAQLAHLFKIAPVTAKSPVFMESTSPPVLSVLTMRISFHQFVPATTSLSTVVFTPPTVFFISLSYQNITFSPSDMRVMNSLDSRKKRCSIFGQSFPDPQSTCEAGHP